MLGTIIFDQLNDVIYSDGDNGFCNQLKCMAVKNGLLHSDSPLPGSDSYAERDDLLVQLFSPFIASHRIMSMCFHNAYEAVTCKDGTEVHLLQFLQYQCVCVASKCGVDVSRFVAVFIDMAKLLCGPVLSRLKWSSDGRLSSLLAGMVHLYLHRRQNCLPFHVEAVRRRVVADHIQTKLLKELETLVSRLRCRGRAHAFVAVDSALLCFYSGRNTAELSTADILHLMLLVDAIQQQPESEADLSSGDSSAPCSSTTAFTDQTDAGGRTEEMVCFLQGSATIAPHRVTVHKLQRHLYLVIVLDLCAGDLCSAVYDSLDCISQYQQPPASTHSQPSRVYQFMYNRLKRGVSLTMSRAKKFNQSTAVRRALTRLRLQWQQLLKGRLQQAVVEAAGAREGGALQLPPVLEQGLSLLADSLQTLFSVVCDVLTVDRSVSSTALLHAQLQRTSPQIRRHWLSVQLGSVDGGAVRDHYPHVSISRYLDSCPSVLYFIYVDRSSHLVTAPTPPAPLIHSVWRMVTVAYRYLYEGYLTVSWSDKQHSYSHFVWFEDPMGCRLKPNNAPTRMRTRFPKLKPGVFVCDYFSQLVQLGFPDALQDAVSCFQLFLIQSGDGETDGAVVQSHRIAHAVRQLSGSADVVTLL